MSEKDRAIDRSAAFRVIEYLPPFPSSGVGELRFRSVIVCLGAPPTVRAR